MSTAGVTTGSVMGGVASIATGVSTTAGCTAAGGAAAAGAAGAAVVVVAALVTTFLPSLFVKILSPVEVVSNLFPSSHVNTVLPLSCFVILGPATAMASPRKTRITASVTRTIFSGVFCGINNPGNNVWQMAKVATAEPT